MCALARGEIGIAFGMPRIDGDTARVRLMVLGRKRVGGMYSDYYVELTLSRRRDDWLVTGRRWLGAT
jgi:hypothetical protein